MSRVIDWRLRARMLASLVVVLLVNALVLAGALTVAGVLVLAVMVLGVIATAGASSETVATALLLVSIATVGGAVLAVVLQVRHGARTVLGGLDADPIEEGGPRNVTERVRRLAARADVAAPAVALVDEAEPTCLTVRDAGSPTILVTTGLLDQLDDDELDAVLAHEVAHVANGDVFLATVIASMVTVADRLFERERAYRRLLSLLALLLAFGITIVIFALPIAVIALLHVVVSLVARIVLGANAIVFGLFARTREYSADRAACELTGDPAALASALETIEGGRPETDARLHATSALGVVPRPLEFGDDDDEADDHWLAAWLESIGYDGSPPDGWAVDQDQQQQDPHPVSQRIGDWSRSNLVDPVLAAFRRLFRWRPASHPPTDRRIDRLREIDRP